MAYTQEQRFDHHRDLRKNGDLNDFPDRMNRPLTTAMDVTILVKGLSDYTAAAKLIEQYAQTVAAAARLQGVVDTSERVFATLDSFASEGA